MKHIVYQIINLINQKIYIGIHSTETIEDGYMGSGTQIRRAIKKHGVENFKREVLFEYDSIEEASLKESELVDIEFIARKDVYNIKTGGDGWNSTDTISVKDSEGNCFRVHKTDERWLSGELKGITSDTALVKDFEGNCSRVPVTDPRRKSGELTSPNVGMVIMKNVNGDIFRLASNDPRIVLEGLISITTGTLSVRDKNGKTFRVSVDDERYLSGELESTFKGNRMVTGDDGNIYCLPKDDPRIKSGELFSITRGKVIVKDKDGNRFMVSKDDPRYLSGELVFMHTGRKLSKETIEKIQKNRAPRSTKHTETIREFSIGTVPVIDNEGNSFRISKNDQRWINKEVYALSSSKGKEIKTIFKSKL